MIRFTLPLRLLLLVPLTILGCSHPAEPPPAAVETMVYYDTALKKSVLRPKSKELPALNPETGKRTLMPAAWCPGCDDWHAAPPIEEVQRNPNALICTKTGRRMSSIGPEP